MPGVSLEKQPTSTGEDVLSIPCRPRAAYPPGKGDFQYLHECGFVRCAIRDYMSLLGKQGLKELAQLNLDKAEFAKREIEKIEGVQVKRSSPTFNEFTVYLPVDASVVAEAMIKKGFAAGFLLGGIIRGWNGI